MQKERNEKKGSLCAMHLNKKDLIKRYIFLFVGLTIMAFGIAFSIKANLGTSPISSVPYVVSSFTSLSVGEATIIMHCVFILFQILLLRKNFALIQLMQLPVAFIFGYLTDFAIWVLQFIHCDTYWERWIICGIGIVVIAVGVSLEVISDVVTLAGEGLSLAICQVAPVRFGNMKVIFDITLVIIACILGLIFTHRIQGVREGTVAAAVFVGLLTKFFMRFYYRRMGRKNSAASR